MPAKIIYRMTEKAVTRLIGPIKKNGRRIVFTNGVFDILHYGHIDYLAKAERLGDILIVGVNSDASVKSFKAANRPIQGERDRAKTLAALEFVDHVIIFNESTPERLIRMVKPDVLVKGADYKMNEIVGAKFVKSYGGSVRRIRYLKGYSTTNIIRKIVGRKGPKVP